MAGRRDQRSAGRLRLAGVQRHFGRRAILAGVDLDVAAGRRVALLGANGCGKTTLLRVIAGTLAPTGGTVHAPRTAYVPQESPAYPELTAMEHLAWWRRMHGIPQDPDNDQASLRDAGIGAYAHRAAGVLSRGQRQRLALLAALAVDAPLTVLDEPYTALDLAGQAWLDAQILAWPGTLIAALHDPERAEQLFHQTHTMEGGRL